MDPIRQEALARALQYHDLFGFCDGAGEDTNESTAQVVTTATIFYNFLTGAS